MTATDTAAAPDVVAPETEAAPATKATPTPAPAKPKAEKKPAEKKTATLTFERKQLVDALGAAVRSTASALTPVLSGVLIEAVNGKASITGTDSQMATTVRLAATGKSTVKAVVKGQLLMAMVKATESDDVSLEFGPDVVRVSAGEFTGKLLVMDSAGFLRPEMPANPVELDAADVVDAVSRVLHACSSDEARPILTAVHLFSEHGKAGFVATDSYRLAVSKSGVKGFGNALVPADALQTLIRLHRLADQPERVIVALDATSIGFQVGDCMVTARLIEGKFPEWTKLVPDAEACPSRVVVNRDTLIGALRRGLLLGAESPIRLELSGKHLTVKADNGETGSTSEKIAADATGEKITVAVNGKFMVEALRAIDDDDVTLHVQDGVKPMLLTSPNKAVRQIVMPVRVPTA